MLSADAREQLRQATASLHEQVDATMPLAREGADLADYARHLALLRAWVDILRRRVPGISTRLAQEAAALDVDLRECRRLLGPGAPEAPAPDQSEGLHERARQDADDEALAWGVRYVLEGSRLGGQVLYRRLENALAPHPLAYLRGAGPATGAGWRMFLADLRSALDTPARVRRACEGAAMAFGLLLQCGGGLAGSGKSAS